MAALTIADFDQPWETTDAQRAFPADALERMPPYDMLMDMVPDKYR